MGALPSPSRMKLLLVPSIPIVKVYTFELRNILQNYIKNHDTSSQHKTLHIVAKHCITLISVVYYLRITIVAITCVYSFLLKLFANNVYIYACLIIYYPGMR